MALKYLQGFDHWPTGTVLAENIPRYGLKIGSGNGDPAVNAVIPRISGKAFAIQGDSGSGRGEIMRREPEDLTSLVTGIARTKSNSATSFTNDVYVDTSASIMGFYYIDSFGVTRKHCSLHTNLDGHLIVCNSSQAVTSDVSAGNIIHTVAVDGLVNEAGSYAYWEVKLDLRVPAAPVLNVKLNGRYVITDLTLTTLKNSLTNFVNTVSWSKAGDYNATFPLTIIDDWYVLDLEGTDCNDFLGPIRVGTLRPDGASSPTELTPISAASNWQGVYKTDFSLAVPTVYNNAPSFPLEDRYSLEDMPTGLGDLKAVMIEIGVNSTALVSNCKIKAALDTDVVEQTILVNNDQVQQRQFPLSADPSGVAWTKAALDAMEIGFSRED